MLPDIPPLKEELGRKLQAVFRQRVNAYMGAINEAPRYFVKEGRRVVTIRPNDQVDETQLKNASVEYSVRYEDIPNLSISDRLMKIDAAARDMARQISEHAFSEINDAVERVGNVVDGSGKPFSADLYLKALEKIHLDFDEDGKPNELTIVIPPGTEQQAKRAMQSLQEDPIYRRRYDELIAKKRMEWRDREAARKLVG